MTEYVDNDMWLNLEQELTHFDDILGDKDWTSNAGPQNGEVKGDPFNDPNASTNVPTSYEDLLQRYNKEEPSSDQLRSPSRQERIEAVRQLYNRMPTILNASSMARLHKVARVLYKAGQVKEANRIVTEAERTINKSFTYMDDDAKASKSLSVNVDNGDVTANVQITDKEDDSTITKSFDNVLEAVRFFLGKKEE